MFTDLTLLHTAAGHAGECARTCAQTAAALGFSPKVNNLSRCCEGELLSGGTFLFFLGGTPENPLPKEAVPFWLHLHSLNHGALRALRFAVCSTGRNQTESPCAFSNACNAKLLQLGGIRLHRLAAQHHGKLNEFSLHGWLQSTLSPSALPTRAALAA